MLNHAHLSFLFFSHGFIRICIRRFEFFLFFYEWKILLKLMLLNFRCQKISFLRKNNSLLMRIILKLYFRAVFSETPPDFYRLSGFSFKDPAVVVSDYHAFTTSEILKIMNMAKSIHIEIKWYLISNKCIQLWFNIF